MGPESGSRQWQVSLPTVRGLYRLSIRNKSQREVQNLNPGAGLGQYQYGTELSLLRPAPWLAGI